MLSVPLYVWVFSHIATTKAGFLSDPLSRSVYGRGVRSAQGPAVTLMWTTTFVPDHPKDFRPNHFVILQDLRNGVYLIYKYVPGPGALGNAPPPPWNAPPHYFEYGRLLID